jgi:hypothetical protein
MFSLMYNKNDCGKTFPFKSNETKRNIKPEDTSFLIHKRYQGVISE